MAWVTPHTYVPEEYMTALIMQGISDALNETAPAKASVAGEMFRAVGANSIEAFDGIAGQLIRVDAAGIPQFISLDDLYEYAFDAGDGTRTAATFGDLSGALAGPQISLDVNASGFADIWWAANAAGSGSGTNFVGVGVAVDGVNPDGSAADGDEVYAKVTAGDNAPESVCFFHRFSGLSAGAHTFKLVYKTIVASTPTARFSGRKIWGMAG